MMGHTFHVSSQLGSGLVMEDRPYPRSHLPVGALDPIRLTDWCCRNHPSYQSFISAYSHIPSRQINIVTEASFQKHPFLRSCLEVQ